jgi:fructokinase
MLLGGIEAGGTKCLAAIGTGPADIRAETRVLTTSPVETLAALVTFFREAIATNGPIAALGIGAFGPLDLRRESPTFGHITSTPKAGWAWTDLAGPFREALDVPVAIDTDVNAAAVAEWRHGAGRGVDSLLYLTVGTGVGGGAIVNGRPLHGLVHPEMGHVRVPHNRHVDHFEGVCPFHADCLEGLASGPAMAARWECPAEDLPPDHRAWDLEAQYLALALQGFVCTLSPGRIVIGGGVGSAPGLLAKVRVELAELLNGYIQAPAVLDGLDGYVVAPGLGDRAGILGAIELARDAAGT